MKSTDSLIEKQKSQLNFILNWTNSQLDLSKNDFEQTKSNNLLILNAADNSESEKDLAVSCCSKQCYSNSLSPSSFDHIECDFSSIYDSLNDNRDLNASSTANATTTTTNNNNNNNNDNIYKKINYYSTNNNEDLNKVNN
jgi:hypothetical protein